MPHDSSRHGGRVQVPFDVSAQIPLESRLVRLATEMGDDLWLAVIAARRHHCNLADAVEFAQGALDPGWLDPDAAHLGPPIRAAAPTWRSIGSFVTSRRGEARRLSR